MCEVTDITRWELLESFAYTAEKDKGTTKKYELYEKESGEGRGFPIRYTDFELKLRMLTLPENMSLRLWNENT